MSDAPKSLIEGRSEVIDALRQLLVASANAGVREMQCADPDFVTWPLDDPPVLTALVRWAGPPGRLLRFFAHDFGALARQHPRFTAWRRDWGHRFEALQPIERAGAELPTLLWAGMQGIQLLDRDRWRARWLRDPAELRAWSEECEAIAQRCEPAWPSTTLGL
jgi:hypothetical protein